MEFWQSTPFVIIYIVAAGILAFLSFISLKLKHSRTTNTFRAVMLSAFIWVVGYILQISGTNLEFKLIILRIEYAGIISSVFFWFLFVINYTNYRQLIDKWVIGTLAIIPILTYLEVLTLTLHDFFYASYQLEDFNGMLLLTKEYGMGFYIWTGYAYLITTASLLIVFFRAFSLPRKYRNQILPLAISVFLIILPNILYVFNINPIYPFDFTNLFIALVGLIMLISMHLSKFLNMIPVAYNMVVKDAQMGIIIINEYHEILDINNTALKILNQKNYSVIGKTVTDIFPEYQPYLEQNRKEDEFKDELVLGDNLTFEMKVTPFLNQGSESGKIIGLWEITELKSLLK
ncbi:MAG: histidine kinase N-terminal 7TM domain-containing protein, partial [Bacteroidota bacterium]